MQSEKIRAAKEAMIYGLLSGYLQVADKLTEGVLASYVDACEECSLQSLRVVVKRIANGSAGLNTSFPPTPADIAGRATMLDEASKPSPTIYNGLIDMDWGHGRVDMRGLTTEEQDAIISRQGMAPDGRNMAFLTLDEKRAALRQEQIEADPIRPRLRSMSGGD